MGANAQTTVPKYTALTVLPAASMNISAGTGIPVFATTVTRDAAFGGANKVLAEGQTCYLESTNVVQFYDGAAWATVGPAASKIAQVQTVFKSNFFSFASASFTDVTGLSVTITPAATSSTILCLAQVNVGPAAGDYETIRLMRGATAIGVGTETATENFGALVLAVNIGTVPLMFVDSPSTTSATTYKIQALSQGGGTAYINRRAADTFFSGSSSLTVMEILA